MSELKRCPFCGGEAEFATSHKRWVQCKECLAEGVYCDTPEQAIAAWNNRKPVEDVLERLEKLKMAEYDDSDEEVEFTDIEEIFDEGESSGKFKAYGNAIKIIKEELGGSE